jgi:hypothetical protein
MSHRCYRLSGITFTQPCLLRYSPKLTTRGVGIGKHIRAFFARTGNEKNGKVICHAPHLLICSMDVFFSHAGAKEWACERPELRAEANEKEIEGQIL